MYCLEIRHIVENLDTNKTGGPAWLFAELSGLVSLLQTPAEKFPAGGTKISHFGIGIIYASGGVHNTGVPATVGESEGVAYLVKSGFYQPLK